jgi:hypothetical protein
MNTCPDNVHCAGGAVLQLTNRYYFNSCLRIFHAGYMPISFNSIGQFRFSRNGMGPGFQAGRRDAVG